MIIPNLRVALVCLVALSLSGCFGEDVPTRQDVQAALEASLKEGMHIEGLKVEARENVQNEVNPVIQARSTFKLVLDEDYVSKTDEVLEKSVLRVNHSKDETHNGLAITITEKTRDGDKTHVFNLDIPRIKGQALSNYTDGTYVFVDSPEHVALLQEVERLEKLAQEAKEKRQVEQRASLTGTWITTTPISLEDETVRLNDGKTVSLLFEIPAGESLRGKAEARIFETDFPVSYVTFPITYEVAEDGTFVRIVENGKGQHKATGWSISPNNIWELSADGEISRKKYRYMKDRYRARMEKDGPALAQYQALLAQTQADQEFNQAVIEKYKAGSLGKRYNQSFGALSMSKNTYTYFIIPAGSRGTIYGDKFYGSSTHPGLAAVHQGDLSLGETGVFKVTRLDNKNEYSFNAVTRHGITSKSASGKYDTAYTLELVEKLK